MVTAISGAGMIDVGCAYFQRCNDRSTTTAPAEPSIHGAAAASSRLMTSSGGAAKCVRLKAAVAWTVSDGTAEIPFCWLSASQAIGPSAGPSASNWMPPGAGTRLDRSSTIISVKQGS